MTELRINGYAVTMPKDGAVNILLNRLLDDISKPTKASGDTSYSVLIPNVPENATALEYRGTHARTNRFVRGSHFDAEVLQDGAQVFRGVFRLESWTLESFRGNLYGGGSELALVGSTSIQTLDLGSFPFCGPYHWPSIVSSGEVSIPDSWSVGADQPWEGPYNVWFPMLQAGTFPRKDSDARRSTILTSAANVNELVLYAGQTTGSKLPTTLDSKLYRVANATDTTDADGLGSSGSFEDGHIYLSWSFPRIYAAKDDRSGWEDRGVAYNVVDWRTFRPAVPLHAVMSAILAEQKLALSGPLMDNTDFRRLGIVAANAEDGLNWGLLGRCRVEAAPRSNITGKSTVEMIRHMKSTWFFDGHRMHTDAGGHRNPPVPTGVSNNMGRRIWTRVQTTTLDQANGGANESDTSFGFRPHVMTAGVNAAMWTKDNGDHGNRQIGGLTCDGFNSMSFNDAVADFGSQYSDNDAWQKWASIRCHLNDVRYDPSCSFSYWKRPSDFPGVDDGGNKVKTVGFLECENHIISGGNGDNVGSEWRCPHKGRYKLTYHVNVKYYCLEYSKASVTNALPNQTSVLPWHTSLVLQKNGDGNHDKLVDYFKAAYLGSASIYEEQLIGWHRIHTGGNGTKGRGNSAYTVDGSISWNDPIVEDHWGDAYKYTRTGGFVTLTVEGDFEQGDVVTPYIVTPFEYARNYQHPDGQTPWGEVIQRVSMQIGSKDGHYFEAEPLFGDFNLNPAKCLPDITKKSLVESVCTMFNQYLVVDKDAGTATLCPRPSFYRHDSEALDITDAVDLRTIEGAAAEGARSITMSMKQWEDDVLIPVDSVKPKLDIEGDNVFAGDDVTVELPFYQTTQLLSYTRWSNTAITFPFAARPDSWNVEQNDPTLRWPTQPGPRLVYGGQYVPSLGGGQQLKVTQLLSQYADYYAMHGPNDLVNAWPLAETINTRIGGMQVYGDLFGQFWTDYQLYAGGELVEFDALLTPVQWALLGLDRPVQVGRELYYLQSVKGYDAGMRRPCKITLLRL